MPCVRCPLPYSACGSPEDSSQQKLRPVLQVYTDFVSEFVDSFSDMMGDVVTEITVGMGPAGELRYPAYPEGDRRWRFPGVGEFQCYDQYMLSSLRTAANEIGEPDWYVRVYLVICRFLRLWQLQILPYLQYTFVMVLLCRSSDFVGFLVPSLLFAVGVFLSLPSRLQDVYC